MATLTVQTISRAGKNLTTLGAAAAGGGDKFANDGSVMLWISNGDGSDMTLTLTYQITTDGQAVSNRTVTITAAKEYLIGPFPTNLYNDVDGNMNLAYSGVTALKVCPLKLGA